MLSRLSIADGPPHAHMPFDAACRLRRMLGPVGLVLLVEESNMLIFLERLGTRSGRRWSLKDQL